MVSIGIEPRSHRPSQGIGTEEQVKIENPSLNEVCVTLDDGDDVCLAAQYAVTEVQRNNPNCWNIYLVMAIEQFNSHKWSLQELGFVVAGFLSADAKTRLKLRKSIQRSSDGGADNFGNRLDDRDTGALEDFVRLRPEYAAVYEKFKGQF
jgi:hypothetical protein